MNPTSIDTLLKAPTPAVKSAPTETPRDGREFEKHLREATTEAPEPAKTATKPKAPADAPAAEKPAVASDQQENSTAHPDQAPIEELEGAEEAVAVAEEEILTIEPDEVLLSVAATTFAEAAPILVAPAVATQEIVVTVEASSPAPESPGNGDQEQYASVGAQLAELPIESAVGSVEQPADVAVVPEDGAIEPVNPTDVDAVGIESVVPEQIVGPETPKQANAAVVVLPKADKGEQQPLLETAKVAPAQAPVALLVNSQIAAQAEKPQAKSHESPQQETEGEDSSKPVVAEKPVANLRAIAAELVVERVEADHPEAKREAEPASPTPAIQPTSQPHPVPHRTETQVTQTELSTAEQRETDSHMPTSDRARFVQRVANAFRSAQQNDGQIQLRLSPPELGSLKIEIAVRHGVLTANLEAETADARRVLLDNLPALRQRLAEQDIRIEKFEVDIRREGGQSDGQAGAQDRQAHEQSQRAAAQNRIRTPQQAEVITARVPRTAATIADANLDVRI